MSAEARQHGLPFQGPGADVSRLPDGTGGHARGHGADRHALRVPAVASPHGHAMLENGADTGYIQPMDCQATARNEPLHAPTAEQDEDEEEKP